ncbi:MAG TPA: DUF5009 domain-containing protein, partial [Isosphaeraceae bacterium]|nr:DUF5009 domain-containing protein [Isosphaeraceae bacterium]
MSEQGREKAPVRLLSLDAYRGFTMLAMASAGLGIAKVAASQPFSEHFLWDKLAFQVDHVMWRGCSFWDMIQPSFMFIVGVAMPFSYASRQAQGQTGSRQFRHALLRSVLLVLLGVFLSSQGHTHTNWSFVNVLSQIGLGYTFVFLLICCPIGIQVLAIVAI